MEKQKMAKAVEKTLIKKDIIVIGAEGRMGQMVMRAVIAHDQANLCAAISHTKSKRLNQDVGDILAQGKIGVHLSAEPAELFAKYSQRDNLPIIIDFSTIDNALETARLCAQAQLPLVLGVTGFSPQQQDMILKVAHHSPLFMAANFSLGIALLSKLVKTAAQSLPKDYHIEILEMHHHKKIDAPSGTALALGQMAAEGRNLIHDKVACLSREGQMGARPTDEIGYATLRGGDVIGEHEVIFAGPNEKLLLAHSASDRMLFAKGALNAALWLSDQEKGLYGMDDLLNNNEF